MMGKRRIILEDLSLMRSATLFEVPDDIPNKELPKWICATRERFDSCVVDTKEPEQVDYDFRLTDAATKEVVLDWMGTFKRDGKLI